MLKKIKNSIFQYSLTKNKHSEAHKNAHILKPPKFQAYKLKIEDVLTKFNHSFQNVQDLKLVRILILSDRMGL